MAERTEWQRDLEAELRALGRVVELPPAPELAETVRSRIEQQDNRRRAAGSSGSGLARLRRPAWRAAVVIVAALLALLVATPQGRAVITHVFRFSGIELSQQPTPTASPHPSGTLPGRQRVSLQQARQQVAFAILVPDELGRPDDVVVADHGRVATLVWHDTPYGEVRMDEFDGHVTPVYFKKLVYADSVAKTTVSGRKALWIKGPHEISYVDRQGETDTASARLTRGNTLIWSSPRVAMRLEGRFDQHDARTIAGSAH